MIPWIEGTVDVRGDGDIPVSLYIDLASGEALEILVRDGMKVPVPETLEDAYLGAGLSGDIHEQVGRVAAISLGSFRLRDVETAFARVKIRSKQDNADGIVGGDILRRFNLIFDYQSLSLYLKPNRYFAEPF
jgi:hypothetical protein